MTVIETLSRSRNVEFKPYQDRTGLVRVIVEGRIKFFLLRDPIEIFPREGGIIRKWEIKEVLSPEEGARNPEYHRNLLNCFSLGKAKRAVLREIIAPGHCAMLRRNTARRRARAQEMRSGGGVQR